ncbi:hypothetical protein [Lysinibacillus sp. IITD104]|uniref:hypothetical protein n=1 Tax=Lysinibacillus sp. IITD104 TaxID=3116650 RepID=UPI002FCF8235
MLDVMVNDEYKLTSDGMQIVIMRKHIVDPTKSPIFDETKHSAEIREEWKTWKYCGKIEQALEVILRQRVFESEAATLKELHDEIVSFKREIHGMLGDSQ